jgi:hypothetical protein
MVAVVAADINGNDLANDANINSRKINLFETK